MENTNSIPIKRGRGRPKGSPNKPKIVEKVVVKPKTRKEVSKKRVGRPKKILSPLEKTTQEIVQKPLEPTVVTPQVSEVEQTETEKVMSLAQILEQGKLEGLGKKEKETKEEKKERKKKEKKEAIDDIFLPQKLVDPFGADERARHKSTLKWAIIGIFVTLLCWSTVLFIGNYGYMFVALAGSITVLGAYVEIQRNPVGRQITGAGDIPCAGFGYRIDLIHGVGNPRKVRNVIHYSWITAKSPEIINLKEANEEVKETYEKGMASLQTTQVTQAKAQEKMLEAKVVPPLTTTKGEFEKIVETVKEGYTKKGRELVINDQVKVYKDLIFLEGRGKFSGWHVLYTIGSLDFRTGEEILAQERSGGRIWLEGIWYFLIGKEYASPIKGAKFPAPTIVFIPKSQLTGADAVSFAQDANEIGLFVRNLNQNIMANEKAIEALSIGSNYLNEIVNFLAGRLGVKSSDIKRISSIVGETEEQVEDILSHRKGISVGYRKKLDNLKKWLFKSKIIQYSIALIFVLVIVRLLWWLILRQ